MVDAMVLKLGKRIRGLRRKQGLSIDKLAERINERDGISRTTLVKVEQGSGCNIKTLSKIADALGVSLRSLIPLPEGSSGFTIASKELFEQYAGFYGYAIEHYVVEARVNPDGNAFIVHTVSGLHRRVGHEGPITLAHEVHSSGKEFSSVYTESPYMALNSDAKIEHYYLTKAGDRENGPRDRENYQHIIRIPDGLGKASYRFAFFSPAVYPKQSRKRKRSKVPGIISFHADRPIEGLELKVRLTRIPQHSEKKGWMGELPYDASADITERLIPDSAQLKQFVIDETEGFVFLKLMVPYPIHGANYAICWMP